MIEMEGDTQMNVRVKRITKQLQSQPDELLYFFNRRIDSWFKEFFCMHKWVFARDAEDTLLRAPFNGN